MIRPCYFFQGVLYIPNGRECPGFTFSQVAKIKTIKFLKSRWQSKSYKIWSFSINNLVIGGWISLEKQQFYSQILILGYFA